MALKEDMTLAMARNKAKRYGHRVSNAISIVIYPIGRPQSRPLSSDKANRLVEAAKGYPLEALTSWRSPWGLGRANSLRCGGETSTFSRDKFT